MTNVQFEEDEGYNKGSSPKKGGGIVTRVIMKLGLAKDEKTAQWVMVFLTVAFLAVTIFLLFRN